MCIKKRKRKKKNEFCQGEQQPRAQRKVSTVVSSEMSGLQHLSNLQTKFKVNLYVELKELR